MASWEDDLWEEPLRPLRSGSFSYGANGFTVRGHVRAEAPRLHELLFLKQLPGQQYKRQRRWIKSDAKALVKRDWIYAQLIHYGIECKSTTPVTDLRLSLESAVRSGQCDDVPRHIRELRSKLARQYDMEKEPHAEREKIRIARKRDEHEATFEKLSTPTQEAEFDMDLFMRKYFLNDQGAPDPSKTPYPVAVPRFSNCLALEFRAERVHGLQSYLGGRGKNRAIVIGWDEDAVINEACEFDIRYGAESEEEERSERDKRMEKHSNFVRNLSAPTKSRPFSIHQARGSYVISCERISSGFEIDTPMKLRITEGTEGWVGLFDFGLIEGIMRLDVDKDALMARSDDDSDETSDEGDDQENSSRSRKRKAPSPTSRQVVKRARSSSTDPNRRLYLLWRGRDTGTSAIQPDFDRRNTGYLEFRDRTCTKFKGQVFIDMVGEEVSFRGYQTGNGMGPVTKRWSDYSYRQYEAERTGRWG